MSYSLALQIKKAPRTSPQFEFSNLPDFGLKIPLRNFQTQGVMFLRAAKKCILADSTGLGKSAQCIALVHWLASIGKEDERWVFVVAPSVIYQWADEFKKFGVITPTLGVVERRERVSYYVGGLFRVYILSYQMLLRDWDLLQELGVRNWVLDDAHIYRHHDTKTAGVIKYLTKSANRVVLLTATPFQKNPLELHSLLESLGLQSVFGSRVGFENYYCVMKKERVFLKGGGVRWIRRFERPKNLAVLQKKVQPYLLRRTFQNVQEELPELIVRPLWLPLTEQQNVLYKQASSNVIRAWDAGKFREVRNNGFHFMRRLCAGTRSVRMEDDYSTKLDVIEDFVENRLGDEKVLIYSFYKTTVTAIANRFGRAGRRDYAVISGDVTDKRERETIRYRFLNDPALKILIGTDTVKAGLNLQSARYLLCVDLILNPQEVVQLIGRLRRMGAATKTVVVYFLLTKGTLEERLWDRLRYESAVFDLVFEQRSEVFPPLSDAELFYFMTGVKAGDNAS